MILKYFFILMILMISILSADRCWKIKNQDTQNLCKSKFENKQNCWLIKNRDMQVYCEATAYGKKSCWKIKERDLQALCEAEVAR